MLITQDEKRKIKNSTTSDTVFNIICFTILFCGICVVFCSGIFEVVGNIILNPPESTTEDRVASLGIIIMSLMFIIVIFSTIVGSEIKKISCLKYLNNAFIYPIEKIDIVYSSKFLHIYGCTGDEKTDSYIVTIPGEFYGEKDIIEKYDILRLQNKMLLLRKSDHLLILDDV